MKENKSTQLFPNFKRRREVPYKFYERMHQQPNEIDQLLKKKDISMKEANIRLREAKKIDDGRRELMKLRGAKLYLK
jgi:hypothetical protein